MVEKLLEQPGMAQLKKDHDVGVLCTYLKAWKLKDFGFSMGQTLQRCFSNEDSSWYTFTQFGPEALDPVKAEVAKIIMPSDGRLNGKVIKATKVFC